MWLNPLRSFWIHQNSIHAFDSIHWTFIFVRFFPILCSISWFDFSLFLILGSSWNPFSSQFQTTSWNHFWFLYTTGFAFLFVDCHIMVAFYALIPFLPALEWWLSLVVVAESWTWVVHFRTEIKLVLTYIIVWEFVAWKKFDFGYKIE